MLPISELEDDSSISLEERIYRLHRRTSMLEAIINQMIKIDRERRRLEEADKKEPTYDPYTYE